MSQRPEWIWDRDSRRYFWYDGRTDYYVFADGQQVKRPANHPIPRRPQGPTNEDDPRTVWPAGSRAPATEEATTGQSTNYEARPAFRSAQPPISTAQLQPSLATDPVQSATQALSGFKLSGRAQQVQFVESPQGNSRGQATQGGSAGDVFHYRDRNGIIHAQDKITEVLTSIQTGPQQEITDPVLWQAGIPARTRLLPTDGEAEKLFDKFVRRTQPRNYFVVGRVFFTLWTEPAGTTVAGTGLEESTLVGRYGEPVFSKVRRFVVVRDGHNFCSCLPITTHNNQGVAKQFVKKSDFSIIHTGKTPPSPRENERPRGSEVGMRPHAIRVSPDDPEDKLAPMSRLDYGKVHTVHHNVKVRNLGSVHPHSLSRLLQQFQEVWAKQPSRTEAGSNDPQTRVAVGQPGSSQGQTDSYAPAAVRQNQPRDRRDSNQSLSKASDRSRDIREQSRRKGVSKASASRSQKSGRSDADSDDDASSGHGLKKHAMDAVARLVERGYSKEQAIAAVKRQLAQRRDPIAEESAEDDSGSGQDSDSEDDVQTKNRAKSRDTAARDRRPSQTHAARPSAPVKSQQPAHYGSRQQQGSNQSQQRTTAQRQVYPPRDSSLSQQTGRSGAGDSYADQATRAERAEAAIQQIMAQHRCSREQAIQILRRRLEDNSK